MTFNSKPDPYKVGLVILGVSLLILIPSICAVTLSSEKLLKEIGVGAILGIFLGSVGLLAGVMMTLGNRPETTRAERLRDSMSKTQWKLHQNRRSSRIGLVISGVSLLVVIVTVLANKFFPLRPGQDGQSIFRILGISFGGAGVLGGIIVAVSYYYEGLRATGRRVDDRHAGFADKLRLSGTLAIVFAGASAIGERSWGIGVVVVALSIFEVWAMLWGPRGSSFLTLRVMIQIALFSTFLYAVRTHNSRRHSFNRPAPPASMRVCSSAPFTPATKICST